MTNGRSPSLATGTTTPRSSRCQRARLAARSRTSASTAARTLESRLYLEAEPVLGRGLAHVRSLVVVEVRAQLVAPGDHEGARQAVGEHEVGPQRVLEEGA